jgi:hypothetical protein
MERARQFCLPTVDWRPGPIYNHTGIQSGQPSQYSVGATGWIVWCSNSGTNKNICCSPERTDLLCGLSSHLFSGYRRYFPGAVYLGREVDHSHPCSAEFENEWSYILLSGRKIFTFLHKYISILIFLLQFSETLHYARKAYDVGLCVP